MTALFNGLLVYVTYRLVTSTNKLWEAGERQLTHLEKSSEKQLRAYVQIKTAFYTNIFGKSEYSIEYKNFGQTPARNLRQWNVLAQFPFPNDEKFDATLSKGIGGMGDLAPLHEGHFVKEGPRQLTAEEAQSLRDGTTAIYMWGQFFYEDAFGVLRTTSYRYIVGGNVGVSPLKGGLGICNEGNQAD